MTESAKSSPNHRWTSELMRGEQRWTEVVARRCHGWTRRYCTVLAAMTVVDAARQCAVNKCGCNGKRPVCLLAVGEA